MDPEKENLKIHEDKAKGIFISGVTESYVGDDSEIFTLLKIGNSNRSVGYTEMNAVSSRSHLIVMVTISQEDSLTFSLKTGKLFLVDLAGSERIGKTK